MTGLRVRVARTADEVDRLRCAWDALQEDALTSSPEHFADALVEWEGDRPHLVLVEHGKEPRALLVAQQSKRGLAVQLGYRYAHTPKRETIVVAYRGLLGDVDDEAVEMVAATLADSLRSGSADFVQFMQLDTESTLPDIVTRKARGLGVVRRPPVARWELELPASFDEFVRSRSKATRRIRNYASRLERDFSGDLLVKVYRDPADANEVCEAMASVAARSWQGSIGVGFTGGRARLDRVRSGLERHSFRCYVLYVRGRPVAYWSGNIGGRRFHVDTTEFDPGLGDYRIGTCLLMRVIEDLCEDPTIAVLDYGLGDAEYKRRYGSRRWEERDVVLYSWRPVPLTIGLSVRAIDASLRGTEAMLDRLRLKRVLKRGWRTLAHRRAAPVAEGSRQTADGR